MPEPCNCPGNKNVDPSETPKKCSCPPGTHDTINENQQEISESASSSNKTPNLAPNQQNMAQSSQNKNENGPNMLRSARIENGTSNQPGQVGGTSQNDVNGPPAVTNPWENCKCNFPEISPICKCSETENDVSGDKEVRQLRMLAIKDNVPLDEDKKPDISPGESEAQPDTELASKGQSPSSENKGDKLRKDKAVGDIPPDTDLPSKVTEEQSSPRTHLVEGDVPPDEGEIKDLKDLSKYICTCDKEKQASNKTNQNSDTNPANCERTFIMIKPDGVQRGLVGKIIKRFEQKGFHLVALSFLWPTEELLKKHYAELSDRPFFPTLIQYMSSGPVVPMVWEGLGIVKAGRSLLGATNPADSAAGTIRGDLCIQVGRNICHASDSNDSANKEIDLWFTEKELIPWVAVNRTWVYED